MNLKASASALCNNLTVLSSKEKQSVTYGVVHKAFVCITNVTKGSVVNQKQVSCKGEGSYSSSAVLQVSQLAVYRVNPDVYRLKILAIFRETKTVYYNGSLTFSV